MAVPAGILGPTGILRELKCPVGSYGKKFSAYGKNGQKRVYTLLVSLGKNTLGRPFFDSRRILREI